VQNEAPAAAAAAASEAAAAVVSVNDTMEEELGTTAEEEAEDEKRFSEIAEHEIVGRNLLGVFGPLLARIVANEVPVTATITAAFVGKVLLVTASAVMCVRAALPCNVLHTLLRAYISSAAGVYTCSNVYNCLEIILA
jgi:hypothetical protein